MLSRHVVSACSLNQARQHCRRAFDQHARAAAAESRHALTLLHRQSCSLPTCDGLAGGAS